MKYTKILTNLSFFLIILKVIYTFLLYIFYLQTLSRRTRRDQQRQIKTSRMKRPSNIYLALIAKINFKVEEKYDG